MPLALACLVSLILLYALARQRAETIRLRVAQRHPSHPATHWSMFRQAPSREPQWWTRP